MTASSRFRVLATLVLALATACSSASSAGPTGSSTPTATGSTGTPSPATSTASPPPPIGNGPIGYVGCSNSAAAVNGYHLAGGRLMWPFIRNYGGGTVTQWATGIGESRNQYWSAFTKQLQNQPTTHTFWFQLCATAEESQNNDDEAIAVIEEIRARVPDAVVYISPLNDWVAPHVCAICGPDGPANMEADASQVVKAGEALRGPTMPPLVAACTDSECGISSRDATQQSNEVEPDGCHPNTNGQLAFGERLMRFFG
ncbi:MAG TPA: hypothetical protein VH989_10435 [Actinomycetota bacterium]